MNFALLELDESTDAFRSEFIEFLDEHLTESVHEEEWETGAGHNRALHKALGDRGWIVPTWPKDEGGAGLSDFEAEIINREMGVRHAPTITKGTTSLVLSAVTANGTDQVKEEVIAGVAAGDICFCLGYTEPDYGSDLGGAKTRAVRDGDEWVIDGQKMFTTGAQNCQYAFLVTRTNPDVPKHKGITMFLCPLDGVEIQAVHTLGGERTNMVFFDEYRIPDYYRLGEVDAGWGVLMGPLNDEHGMGDRSGPTLEHRGGMYGGGNVDALQIVVDWASQPDPDGDRPIDDPLVRRRLARVALDLEAMTVAPGPMSRILSAEFFIRDAADMMDLVGPAGLLPHGEIGAIGDGWLEYCHRFAQGTATYGGTTDIHRNIIAERMLGLPRSSPR
jgi:alkylation response protein AidB-like acyl-CoA dehydrogenase